MNQFFAVHTSEVFKTSVHGTLLLGVACTAVCTLEYAKKVVMLGIIRKLLPRPIQKWLVWGTFMQGIKHNVPCTLLILKNPKKFTVSPKHAQFFL